MTGDRARRRSALLSAMAGFVLGGVSIGLVVGLIVGPSSDEGADPAPPSRTAGPVVAVAADCVRAAATIRRATVVIEMISESLRTFDPDRLLVLLDQLEDYDGQARQQAASCVGTTPSSPVTPSGPSPS